MATLYVFPPHKAMEAEGAEVPFEGMEVEVAAGAAAVAAGAAAAHVDEEHVDEEQEGDGDGGGVAGEILNMGAPMLEATQEVSIRYAHPPPPPAPLFPLLP